MTLASRSYDSFSKHKEQLLGTELVCVLTCRVKIGRTILRYPESSDLELAGRKVDGKILYAYL